MPDFKICLKLTRQKFALFLKFTPRICAQKSAKKSNFKIHATHGAPRARQEFAPHQEFRAHHTKNPPRTRAQKSTKNKILKSAPRQNPLRV